MKKEKFLKKHRLAIIGIIVAVVFLSFLYYVFGIGYWFFIPFKERCGGWNIVGETVCECSGILIKPKCPLHFLCDSGSYYCLLGKCGECQNLEVELDCVPAQCCHPTSCIDKKFAPDCTGVPCTLECSPGTMDCGAGYCARINGVCQVVWTEI